MSLNVTGSKPAELCCACCSLHYKAALFTWPLKERTKTMCEQGVPPWEAPVTIAEKHQLPFSFSFQGVQGRMQPHRSWLLRLGSS